MRTIPITNRAPFFGTSAATTLVITALVMVIVHLGVGSSQAFADRPIHVAGPFIEQISPPVLRRGQTNRITLTGRELDGAVDLWASTPGVKIGARQIERNNESQVSFDVEVPEKSPLGIYGMRVATQSGLSNVHLFLIDELPLQSRNDASANESLETARRVSLPAAIHNVCHAATIDRYEIEVTAGQAITFEVVGNRLGKDYDPLVTIRDTQGRIVVERDNDVGLFFDCRFQHRFSKAGSYLVDVRDARYAGDPTWHYILRMGDFPAARSSIPSSVPPATTTPVRLPFDDSEDRVFQVTVPRDAPLGWFNHEFRLNPKSSATWIPLCVESRQNQVESEPNDQREAGTEVTLPATLQGNLHRAGDQDWFRFEMKQGKTMTFRGVTRRSGSPADLELILLDSDGKEVRRVDEVPVRVGLDSWFDEARFDFYAQKDGPHYLCVCDLISDGGPAFTYRVEVTETGPDLQLRSAISRVTVPRGNYQPLPLTITRQHFAGPIQLELLGGPAGVTLEPTAVAADASEIVCRLNVDSSVAEGLSTLQIVGRWKAENPDSDRSAVGVATTFPLIDRRLRDKDLIAYALRDDQLQLPPSLTSHIALQVSAPAPFDVELPEEKLLITKYIDGAFPIVTTRTDGFDAPISFAAAGGQIGDEAEERNNIFLRFPKATRETPNVTAAVFNRILTQYGKTRVDLSATAGDNARRVTLNRTFELEVKSAFTPSFEPLEPAGDPPKTTLPKATLEIEPGGTAQFQILANRVPLFNGSLTLTLTPISGFQCPDQLEIPADQPHVDVAVKADPETRPGRYNIRFVTRGLVGKYEEEVRGPNITITIKKPEPEKSS